MAAKEQKSNLSKKRKQIPKGEKPISKKPKFAPSETTGSNSSKKKGFKKTAFKSSENSDQSKKPFKSSKSNDQSEKPTDPQSKREARLKSKAEVEARKKNRKRNYELQHELAALWEKMRRQDIAKADRSKLVSESIMKMKGKMLEIAGSPVSSRVLQTCVKYCSQDERDAIFEEIQSQFLSLVRNSYSAHLVMKMLDNASKKQLESFISSVHGHVASLLRHVVASLVVERAYSLGNASQKQKLLLELYSTEFQLFKDLVSSKERRLVDLIGKLGLNKTSVLRHMASVIQPILEKGIVDHSIIHTALMEYLTIADKSSAADVLEQLSGPLLIRMIGTRDGSKLGMLCIKHGGAKERKKIIKGMKGHVGKIALDKYGSMVLICILSIVDDTKLTSKIIIRELQEILAELVLNKCGRRPLLQLLHPNCQHYFGPDELALLDVTVPSLCSEGEGSELNEDLIKKKKKKLSELSDDKDAENDAEATADELNNNADLQMVGKGKKDPSLRRLELLVNSGLAKSLVDTCIENAGKLLQSNFGKEIIYEVATGGADGVLQPTLADNLYALHTTIASLAALPKAEELKEEHVLENFHSSRTLRKLVIDCPAFASTLWKTAMEGKCEMWAKGHSCKVVTAFLESTDAKVQDLVNTELKPLVDACVVKVPETKLLAKGEIKKGSD